MLEGPNEKLTYMTELQKLLNKLDQEGYTEQYKVENGKLHSLASNIEYEPQHVKAVNFYRFEGPSNPDDMSICYVIETDDGRKGTLIDAYGVYATEDIGEFMQSVEIFKRTKRTHEHEGQNNDHNQTGGSMPEEVLNQAIDPESVQDPLAQETGKFAHTKA
ncbi:MAG: hypothetical protein INR73_11065 [Williamsia sp.]|nr:hypothetical protein [Williamsia sp.]